MTGHDRCDRHDGEQRAAAATSDTERRPDAAAAASLIVDYVLNAAVGVSVGVEALTSAFPQLYAHRVRRR
jgi:hypothetical protein